MGYKAKMTFSHGDRTFVEGQEVDLDDEQLAKLEAKKLIVKGKGVSEEEVKKEQEAALATQSEKVEVTEKKEKKEVTTQSKAKK